jgi:hypothetical protein
MMKVSINQITPRWKDGKIVDVQIYFTATTTDGSVNLSGYVPIDSFTDSIDFKALEDIIKQKVAERILNSESPTA